MFKLFRNDRSKPRSVAGRSSEVKPTKRRFTKKRVFLSFITVVVIVLVATGSYLGWKIVANTTKAAHGNIFGLLSDAKLQGESTGRVNILLAGNSADDPGHQGADLTDSIMILSIDTKNNSAFMLSIPRDLWVDVPGNGYQKINAANADGDTEHFSAPGYPSGGMGLLEEVVDQDFGIKINYYTLIDYTAFKQAVDTVGGITVDIQSPDPRGIYDPSITAADDGPLILKNGVQVLNGQTALNLARARNDVTPTGQRGYGLPNGDFDRAANQRMMLVALKNKVFTTGILSNPIKIGQLFDTLGSNVHTNFKTDELRSLYDIAKGINSSNIQSLSLTDKNLIVDYTTSDGQDALIPAAGVGDYTQIQSYLRQLTSSDPVVQEGASVVVLNGSGVTGLAAAQAKVMSTRGLDVASYANSPVSATTTEIIDDSKGKAPATLACLKSTYGDDVVTSSSLTSYYPNAQFIVVLGSDQSTSSTTAP